MRILQVVHGFPPESNGGAEKYTYGLSLALAQRHEVHVLCPSSRGEYLSLSSREESPLFRHEIVVGKAARGIGKALRAYTRFEDTYFNPEVNGVFEAFLQRLQPDVIHFQHLLNMSASLIEIAASLGIPTVLTLHDYWFMCPTVNLFQYPGFACPGPEPAVCRECWANYQARIRSPFAGNPGLSAQSASLIKSGLRLLNGDEKFAARHAYMQAMLSKVDRIIAPSRFLRDQFISAGVPPRKIIHLENGRNQDAPDVITEKPIGKKLVFGFVGRITPIKGVHTLVDAFLRVPEGTAELRIYGGYNAADPYAAELLKKAAGRQDIRFMGFVRDVNAVYPELDLLVFPSLWYENCPLTLAESCVNQTAVIASNIGAIPEFVSEGVNGVLFEPGNAEDLSEKIMTFIRSPDHLKQLPVGSSRCAVPMQGHALDVEAIYEECTKEREHV